MRPPLSRGCRDHRATRRAFMGRAAEVVPVPADALHGLAAFERSGGMTRRDLLERGVGLWVGASAVAGLTTRGLLEAASAQAQSAPDATILVSLYLDGGNDGLNTLVLVADPRYRELRPRLAVAPETTLPLPGVPQFGWHPAAEGLRALYDQGKVAVLPSVDFADADQSHFSSVAYWRRGIVGQSYETTGWLGRTLDAVGTGDNPLQGISVSWSPDPVLSSGRAPTATVYDPNGFRFYIEGVWGADGFTRACRDAVPRPHGLRRPDRGAPHVRERLRGAGPPGAASGGRREEPTAADAGAYPDSDLGTGLRNLARMLAPASGRGSRRCRSAASTRTTTRTPSTRGC